MAKDTEGLLSRTFFLTPEENVELQQVAADANQTEEELIRELLAEGIKSEYSRYPALKRAPPAIMTGGDFLWAWLPGHTVKKTVMLSPEEDRKIRQISFAQGAIAGDRFYFLVINALKHRRSQEA